RLANPPESPLAKRGIHPPNAGILSLFCPAGSWGRGVLRNTIRSLEKCNFPNSFSLTAIGRSLDSRTMAPQWRVRVLALILIVLLGVLGGRIEYLTRSARFHRHEAARFADMIRQRRNI